MTKLKKYIPFIFFGLVALFFIARELLIKYRLQVASRYTVGTIQEISTPVEGGSMADYTFMVNNKKYSGTFGITPQTQKIVHIKKKFVVQYYTQNPEISYPFIEQGVDSNTTAPPNGWSYMPKGGLEP